MAISKFDLLFDLVTQLPRKTIEFFLVHDFICGPILVTIVKRLRPVSRAKQTDRQTNIPLNEQNCKNFYEILASNKGVPCAVKITHKYYQEYFYEKIVIFFPVL